MAAPAARAWLHPWQDHRTLSVHLDRTLRRELVRAADRGGPLPDGFPQLAGSVLEGRQGAWRLERHAVRSSSSEIQSTADIPDFHAGGFRGDDAGRRDLELQGRD